MAFTSGVVGIIHGDLQELQDDYITQEVGDETLECYINVDKQLRDVQNNLTSLQGKVASQAVSPQKTVSITNDNKINIVTNRDSGWNWTNYWLVPGKFVVAEKTADGEFPFSQLTDSTGVEITRARFRLSDIVEEYPGQWMGGFQDREERVRSGTLYGEEIEEDIDMGDAFLSSDKNQIGPKIEFGGTEVKVRITEDGLVQVVGPGNYKREKYLAFIEEMLFDFAY